MPLPQDESEINQRFLGSLKQFKLFSQTNFVMLFGSVSKGKQTPLSDVDFCVSLNLLPKDRFRARMHLLGQLPEHFDVQIFEDLPLYMKKSVLSGKLVYCRNQPQLVQQALRVIADYEDFEPIYNSYIARRKQNLLRK